jgi:hypothetical protein
MQLRCCGKGAVGAQIEGSLRFLKEKGHAQAQAINLGERMGTHLQRRCCTAAQSCGTANRNPKPHSAHAQIPLVLSKDMLHQPSCSVLRVALDILPRATDIRSTADLFLYRLRATAWLQRRLEDLIKHLGAQQLRPASEGTP